MIEGGGIRLRRIRDEDWPTIERWVESGELWGEFQRRQLDHLPLLRKAYEATGLLSRASAMLLIEPADIAEVVGFVRYTMMEFPDGDFPHPEVGFGVPEPAARGSGIATAATRLVVEYLFDGYDCRRISAVTDAGNVASQRVLEHSGFVREGVMRRASFRAGEWRDMVLYGLLRGEQIAT